MLVHEDQAGDFVLSLDFQMEPGCNSGVFVRTNKPLPRGQNVDIRFKLPDSQDEIKAACLVRWCHMPTAQAIEAGAQPPGMGLEFTSLTGKNKKLLQRYIETFINRMRR